jgi:hypothetical protein
MHDARRAASTLHVTNLARDLATTISGKKEDRDGTSKIVITE